MPIFLKSTLQRLAMSVLVSLVLCACHCALAAEFSPAALCAAAPSGSLITFLDPFNIILLSVFVYSLLSLAGGQNVASLGRKLRF